MNIDMKKLAKEMDFGDDVEFMIINKEQILFDSSGENKVFDPIGLAWSLSCRIRCKSKAA